jgi:hypothetical protein
MRSKAPKNWGKRKLQNWDMKSASKLFTSSSRLSVRSLHAVYQNLKGETEEPEPQLTPLSRGGLKHGI